MTSEYKQIANSNLEIFTKEILALVADGWTVDEGYPANAIWCYEAYLTRVATIDDPVVNLVKQAVAKVGRPAKKDI